MLPLLLQYFGPSAYDALIIHRDGEDWVSSKSLCNLMGTHCEYHLVEDQGSWPEMNLAPEDRRKFYDDRAHKNCPVWFVSESGFWKIAARSNTLWARKFRASFLPM